ncbi:MAG: aminomethyltransferase family protein [Actinomycetota bacterium]
MSEEIFRTAFDRPQRAMRVVQHLDSEGWYWPKHFGDPVAEHRAIRSDVGVWDASPLRKLAFSGPDAVKAVDRIFTNDMVSLEVGQVRYTPFCDEKGKMVGECTVFKTADDAFIAVTALDSDLDHCRAVAGGLSVEIEATTRSLPQLGITGPRSRALLQSLTEADVSGLRYFRFWPEQVEVGGVPCLVSRLSYSGELGYELYCSPDGAEQLWDAVVGAGATPFGLAAVETIRIESGLLFIGRDYFQHQTSPFDVGLDKLVRLDKARFCGRDALAAEAASPPNRFVTLVVDGAVPAYGAAVTKGGEQVGTLTSSCESPTLGKVIGLTVLRSDLARVGERVEVSVEGGSAPATVAPVPLYDTEKKRPRA